MTSSLHYLNFVFFSNFFWSKYDFQIYWTRIGNRLFCIDWRKLQVLSLQCFRDIEKWRKQSGGATSKWRYNGKKFFLFRISVENPITCDLKQNSIRKWWKKWNILLHILGESFGVARPLSKDGDREKFHADVTEKLCSKTGTRIQIKKNRERWYVRICLHRGRECFKASFFDDYIILVNIRPRCVVPLLVLYF